MRKLDAPQLAEYLNHSQPLLIDVREPWEFEICHLEDSTNIPMGQIPQHLSVIGSANECGIICHHGVRSLRVIQYLQQQDMDHLINLEGGVDGWARQVDKDMLLY
jgi:rhodanese-related sulfurtransferase